jgi:signal peptidase I
VVITQPKIQVAGRITRWIDEHPRVFWGMVIVYAAIFTMAAISPWYQIHLRDQASWPFHTVFLIKKGILPERGALVAFQLRAEYVERIEPRAPRPHIPVNTMWMKRVLGMPGDRVDVVENQVVINGHAVASGFGRDRFGVPVYLTSFRGEIPPHQYYVSLPHLRSVDSRYYGLVKERDVIGLAIPLL